MENKALIHLEHVKKEFPSGRKGRSVKALNDITLDIYQGEVLGVVGESGCGKSTLGRTILRLIPPSCGTITYDGRDVGTMSKRELRALRREMQIVFQDPYGSLNPKMNIAATVRAPLDVHKIGSPAERNERTLEMLRMVGLGKQHLERYPSEFSGGQRQRIDIARALILQPRFVVCDEPVSALDVSIRAQVLNLMTELREKMDLTYMFISHDLSVVKHISTRIAVMYLGRIVEIASTDELYKRPLHPYTKVLLSAIPIPEVGRHNQRIILKGELPNAYELPKGCSLCNRCPYATERCFCEEPQLREVERNHFVSCFLEE